MYEYYLIQSTCPSLDLRTYIPKIQWGEKQQHEWNSSKTGLTHFEDVLRVPGVAEDNDEVHVSLRAQHWGATDVYGVSRINEMKGGVWGGQLVREGIRVRLCEQTHIYRCQWMLRVIYTYDLMYLSRSGSGCSCCSAGAEPGLGWSWRSRWWLVGSGRIRWTWSWGWTLGSGGECSEWSNSCPALKQTPTTKGLQESLSCFYPCLKDK